MSRDRAVVDLSDPIKQLHDGFLIEHLIGSLGATSVKGLS
jgi:hypothetical protein